MKLGVRMGMLAALLATVGWAGCGGEDAPAPKLADFDRANVELLLEKPPKKEGSKEGSRALIYFVATGDPKTHVFQAKACALEFRRTHETARCFAWPSQYAYDYSKVNPKNGDWENSCWSARWKIGADKNGDIYGDALSGNVRAAYDGCPSAYTGGIKSSSGFR